VACLSAIVIGGLWWLWHHNPLNENGERDLRDASLLIPSESQLELRIRPVIFGCHPPMNFSNTARKRLEMPHDIPTRMEGSLVHIRDLTLALVSAVFALAAEDDIGWGGASRSKTLFPFHLPLVGMISMTRLGVVPSKEKDRCEFTYHGWCHPT
jgi:hypothetical protein